MADSVFAGRYEILEEIGRGGMGRVVKARDISLGRIVAIKIVQVEGDPEVVDRLVREAKATALLSHPNIVTAFDVGFSEGLAYIVMEYVTGATLGRRMADIEPSQVIPILSACADALDYAHRKGIIHRDIKPSNIMIRNDWVPKILDFGIAKLIANQDQTVTQDGLILGTLQFLSPERITGGVIGPQTDQYALALIAYRLLAGRYPFIEDGAISEMLNEAANKEPPPPSSFNPALSRRTDQVILRALSKNPASRFLTCRELFDELLDKKTTQPLKPPVTIMDRVKRLFTSAPEEEIKAHDIPAPRISPPFQELDVPRPIAPRLPASFDPPVPGEFTAMFNRAEQTALLRKPAEERVDPETIARAQARELIEILERREFESAVALRGKWLPGIEGASGELIGFSEAARYLGAAQEAVSPHVRIEHLKRAEKVLFSVGNQLLADTGPALRHLLDALNAWKAYSRQLLFSAEQKAASELPNPFRAGQPLRPDQGRSVFRGRNALVRSIEAILADAEQNSSLALLGPRRCGKTSLLQMLPAMLPDCACVFFDLQDNPVSTVPEFFEALARRAREQVRLHRRLELPPLEDGGAFESATRWFDQLDGMTEVNRFLICIDEFERLEDLFPGDRRELLRLMGLFRGTIQHRRKVRLLVSGVAPFEELGSLWNDHFINVRELRIGHLDEETSIDLLVQPIPEFPPDAVPVEVARRIFERTAGQPYLLQLFGTLLINRLNEQNRMTARIDDVPAIEAEALSQGRYYFGNTYQDATQAVRESLEALALGEKTVVAGPVRRWLERRWLIDEHGALRTPVLGEFIRQELGA